VLEIRRTQADYSERQRIVIMPLTCSLTDLKIITKGEPDR
jgi:hypothetical protein